MGKVEAVTDFIFLGSKSTVDPDCSHEIKRCLLLAREAMTNSDITLLTKVCTVKAMVFPVVMYGCERWTIKKAECWRIDPFKWWCRRLLRVPWIARGSSQSILKEINPEYSLKWLLLKLKLQCFGPLMQRAESLDEMVGWHHRISGHEFEETQGDSEGQGSLACCSPWGCKESDTTYWLNNHNKKKSTVKAVKKRAQIVWLHLHEILEKAN